MIVTPKINARNRLNAVVIAVAVMVFVTVVGLALSLGVWSLIPGLGAGLATFRSVRRKCVRRLWAVGQSFPEEWNEILVKRVRFYRALSAENQERFRKLVQIFLSEVRVTGIRTEIDDTIRVLTAASAVIPIFGFEDWDYRRLGEVLIYPASFDDKYKSEGHDDRNILGLTGLGSLSGVMILSKPALLEGYRQENDKENVGIHEFAHLVEDGETLQGLPWEVPMEVVQEWVRYVATELAQPGTNPAGINAYGYTNEHEFFAVLAEYFFESPELLQRKNPKLYGILRAMFHQDPAALFSQGQRQRSAPKNAPCPCGSGQKFQDCCRPQTE